MKLKTTKNTVETSEDFQELSFGIRSKDMGIILEILRSKMYKNPIGAICREVASNSRDANREVKNRIPVEIKIGEGSLFSPTDLTISFIDNGPGISPERMSDVFVNYGASTKRGTNTQTGGFGLGAKTPFAYTDNFTIITRVDKQQYTYSAAIEENNTGKIYLMDKSETKENNGTTITIPIKHDDRRTFENEVLISTYFWKVRPNYINFKKQPEKIKQEKIDGCFNCESTLFQDNFYLLIDDIPYQHDGSVIRTGSSYYSDAAIFLPFKTGQLTISANRESVQYDKPTIKAIETKFESLLEKIFDKVSSELAACKTYAEAAILYKKNHNSQFYSLLTNSGKKIAFTYQGKRVNYHINHNDMKFRKVTDSGTHNYPIREYQKEMLEWPIYAIDTHSLTASRNKTILKSHNGFFAIEFSSKDLKAFRKLSFKKRKHFAGRMRNALKWIEDLKEKGLKVQLYSNVPPSKIAKSPSTPCDKETIAARIVTDKLKFSGHCLRLANVKPTDKIAYQTYNGDGLNTPTVEKQKVLARFILLMESVTTYFINVRNEKFVIGKISSLNKAISSIPKKKFQTNADQKFVQKHDLDNLREVSKLDFSKTVKDQIQLLQDLKTHSSHNVPKQFEVKPSKEVEQAVETVKTIFDKYPLVKHFDSYSYRRNDVRAFNEYIKLIDQKGGQKCQVQS